MTTARAPGVSQFSVGDTLAGSFGIETSVTTNLIPGNPNLGYYEALNDLRVTTSQGYADTSSGGLVVVDREVVAPGHALLPVAFADLAHNLVGPNVMHNGSSWQLGSLLILLEDPTGTALDSNTIPHPLDLTRFQNRTFEFAFLPEPRSESMNR